MKMVTEQNWEKVRPRRHTIPPPPPPPGIKRDYSAHGETTTTDVNILFDLFHP